jgi:protein O-mannosyl-transferase
MTSLRRHAPLLAAGLVVVALTLATFAGTLSAAFVAWDDGITIYNNPRLGALSLDRLAWAFTDVATTMRWVPLNLLSLSLTHTIHGLDPFGYHLHSWLIHGAAALLLFLLLRELLGRAARRRGDPSGRDAPWVLVSAAAGALAWSLHPLRAEVVAWSNSRGHVQAGLFTVLSLLVYVRGHRDDAAAPRPWRTAVLSAGCFLAALLSHPIAIGAAPLFPLLDLHLGRLGGAAGWWTPAARRVLLEKLPFAGVAAGVLVVTLLIRTFSSGMWPAPVPLEAWGIFPRAVQATYAWIHYALVTLWPVGLQPAPTELIDFDPWTAPFLLRAVAVPAITVGLLLRRRRWPVAWLAWLAWLALCFPALGLTEHPMFACDRYTNLPDLVPAALVGGGLLRLGGTAWRRRVAGAAAAALLALLGGLAHAQTRVWSSSVALFEHMLPLIGDHPYRQNIVTFLGAAYLEAGRPGSAAATLEQAAAVAPSDPSIRIALGDALTAMGRAREAAQHYGVAVQFDQISADLRCRYAYSLVAAGRPEEARAQAQVALRINPRAACAQAILTRFRSAP